MKFCCPRKITLKNHFIVHIGFGPNMIVFVEGELVSLRVIFSVGGDSLFFKR
jgi:hypothetical protein